MEIPKTPNGKTKNGRNCALTKSDGTRTRTPLEGQQRRAEWVEQKCSVTQGGEPKITHIQEHTWRKLKHEPTKHEIHKIPDGVTHIRTESKLQTIMRGRPHTQEWIARPYTHDEIAGTPETQKK